VAIVRLSSLGMRGAALRIATTSFGSIPGLELLRQSNPAVLATLLRLAGGIGAQVVERGEPSEMHGRTAMKIEHGLRRVAAAMTVGLMFSAACGDGSNEASQAAPQCLGEECGLAPSVGCQAWREATCAHVQRCGGGNASCLSDYRSVVCSSEEEAEDCAAAVRDAACGALPAHCLPAAVADTIVARAGCEQFRSEVCASAADCGLGPSLEACLAAPTLDCGRALGLRDSFPQCIEELSFLDCRSWAAPESCLGVVLVR
jgi:hypothetical protein